MNTHTHTHTGTLHKDERKNSLELLDKHGAHAKVLEKVYTEQLLSRVEMSEFAECLQGHQKVRVRACVCVCVCV